MNGFVPGLVSVSFRDLVPAEIIRRAMDCGLRRIEWGSDVHAPADRPESLREIVRLSRDAGIGISSYGTYFRIGVTPLNEFPRYLEAASVLGTDILRLWCGDRGSASYSPDERARITEECAIIAAKAREAGCTVSLECHRNTLTDRETSILALMKDVGSPAFRMHWQPNQERTFEENLACAQAIAPYVTVLHVFHWIGKEKYPLAEGREDWLRYLNLFRDKDLPLLLEFMPDGSIETLPREAQTLRELISGGKTEC